MLKGRVFLPVGLVVQHCVPVKERASATVLSNNAAIVAICNKAGIGHGFGKAPIHIDFPGHHFYPLCDDPLHPPVRHESRRH